MTAIQRCMRVCMSGRRRAGALAACVCLGMALIAYPVGSVTGPGNGGTPPGTTPALVPVPGSPFAAASYPFSVTVDPTGKFVYVADRGS